jgi:hypothetical protein
MNRLDVLETDTPIPGVMRRATVCLWTEAIEEKVEFTAWQTAWKRKMTFVSHDYGCGCCIHLFDLEGTQEAIDALPRELLAGSAWTESGLKQIAPHRQKGFNHETHE